MKGVDYYKPVAPDKYQCGACGVTGVKLWRKSYEDGQWLLCAHCACSDQGEDVTTLSQAGRVFRVMDGAATDQIGTYVPAVPLPEFENIEGFWAYTSVPLVGVLWWSRLPNSAAERQK